VFRYRLRFAPLEPDLTLGIGVELDALQLVGAAIVFVAISETRKVGKSQ
jgi:hypothetical protein